MKNYYLSFLLFSLSSLLCIQEGIAISDSKPFISADTWKQAIENKTATLEVVGYHAPPYIFINEIGQPEGICWDILLAFKEYAKQQHNVVISLTLRHQTQFSDALNLIINSEKLNVIGAGNYSILEERKALIQFSPAFLPDLGVIISSKNLPIVNSQQEFLESFSKLTAVTLRNTTYEKDLLSLKKYYLPDIEILFVDSEEGVINEINNHNDYFGYVDLSTYFLSLIDKQNIRRQNLFLSHKEGYAFTIPRYSDWERPFRDFMISDFYQSRSKEVLERHLGGEIYSIVKQMVDSKTEDAVILLTKEVEIQQQRLLESALELERSKNVRNYLIVAFLFAVMVISFLINRYQIKQKASREQDKKNNEIRENRAQIKMQNLQLEKKNQELLELNEEKNHLIQIVAHDLKSPLNQIKGLLNILKLQAINLNEDDKNLIEEAESSAARMTGMISRILNVNNIENKESNTEKEKVDINEIIEKQIINFETLARKKSIKLLFTPKEDMPTILSDAFFISQILENLISNAIKFSPFEKNVWISTENLGDKIKIKIQDQGPGFKHEEIEKAFKKYQKLSAKPTGGEESTGLGLSIVRKYTQALNGNIELDTRPDEGASFSLILPIS
jgi:signal transduction histidine kinase